MSNVNAARQLREVVGARVKKLREEAGKRQDDISVAARALGLAWSRSKVAALERGEKSISAEELILLLAVLTSVIDQPVTLADLFDAPDTIELTGKTGIAACDVPRALLGSTDAKDFIALGGANDAEDFGRGFDESDRLLLLGPATSSQENLASWRKAVAEVQRASGEVERRAAAKVGVEAPELAALSVVLWGHALSEERDRRLGVGASAAQRGRATRELYAELEARIARSKKQGDQDGGSG